MTDPTHPDDSVEVRTFGDGELPPVHGYPNPTEVFGVCVKDRGTSACAFLTFDQALDMAEEIIQTVCARRQNPIGGGFN